MSLLYFVVDPYRVRISIGCFRSLHSRLKARRHYRLGDTGPIRTDTYAFFFFADTL